MFDASVLDLPLEPADPAAQQLAIAQCQRDLDALARRDELLDRVRTIAGPRTGSAATARAYRRGE